MRNSTAAAHNQSRTLKAGTAAIALVAVFGLGTAMAGQGQGGNSGGSKHQSAGTHGGSNSGTGGQKGAYTGGQMRGKGGKGGKLSDIFRDVTGASDDDSDRPEWAGKPGGKDGAGGGQPDTSGTSKGDLYGDLWIILRDDNGVPILTPEGWVQPLDSEGNLVALDDEGHPVDETLTQEVEMGRLNVSRAPASVLDRRAEEVVTLLNQATALSTDAAGRLVLTVDGEDKTIDSPLENLAIYVALMTTGTIPGVADLPGTEFDHLVDGTYTLDDLGSAASFIAAATDKTGEFSPDEIAYVDVFLGINTTTVGSVTYSQVDYGGFTYDRETTYGDVTASVLVEQADGSFVPTVINVFDTIFESTDASDANTLDAFTLAADDARTVVNYVHEFEIPDLDSNSH